MRLNVSSTFLLLGCSPFGDVSFRRLAQVLADLAVGFLWQIGERHANGPIWSTETAAV